MPTYKNARQPPPSLGTTSLLVLRRAAAASVRAILSIRSGYPMMLLSAPNSAEKFSDPIPGLRSLLVVVPGDSRGVVTRAVVDAAARGCRGDRGDVVQESRDVASVDSTEEDNMEAKEGEEDKNMEDEEGCWVSYGRRSPRRLLPPPIPSLAARGALRRTRTADGRLVIRIVPVVRPECTRARRRGGRLTMQLVEREDESPFTPPSLPAPISAREDDVRALQEPDDDTTAPAVGEGIDNDTASRAIGLGVDNVEEAAVVAPEMLPAPVHMTRVPSVGCFEDVFKYSSIASTSLHKMPSLRMVH